MRLEDALAEVERMFKTQVLEPDQPDPADAPVVMVVSGAIKEHDATFPILCNSEALAVNLWLREVKSYGLGRGGAPLYWREKPRMRSFQMTMAEMVGKTQTQRLVTTRYVVSSALGIGRKP